MGGVTRQSGLLGHWEVGRGKRLRQSPEFSPHPCPASQNGSSFKYPSPTNSKGAAVRYHNSFCGLSSVTVHPNVSASVPAISPARAGPLPRLQGHASRISPPPGRRPPGRPLAHAQRCHTRSHLAQTPSHLLPRSAGTLRTRPAPGRPAALPALPPAPARAPAARPPLAASFREPGRPLAAAMMVPSRDGARPEAPPLSPAPKPRPRPLAAAER